MSKIVLMLIICMVPGLDGNLKEAWRIEEEVSLEHCLTMNQVISGTGPAAAIVVKCGSS